MSPGWAVAGSTLLWISRSASSTKIAVAEAELLVGSMSRWSRLARLMVLVCWPTTVPVTRMVRVTVCPTGDRRDRPAAGDGVEGAVAGRGHEGQPVLEHVGEDDVGRRGRRLAGHRVVGRGDGEHGVLADRDVVDGAGPETRATLLVTPMSTAGARVVTVAVDWLSDGFGSSSSGASTVTTLTLVPSGVEPGGDGEPCGRRRPQGADVPPDAATFTVPWVAVVSRIVMPPGRCR